MKKSLILIFLLLSSYGYCQDRIRTVSGEIIQAKVTEISQDEIKYKKYSNPEGPIYILRKDEVSQITYQNGETETFNSKRINKPDENERNFVEGVDNRIVELFYTMTRRNNKVFITSDNENAVVHAKNAINRWGYWIVTEKRYNADFILNFNINFRTAEASGNADFIYPGNGKALRSTPEFYVNAAYDLNLKRGVINKIVEEGIKPMVK